ncbi:MAG: ArsA family ATPase [Nostocoides sp.]
MRVILFTGKGGVGKTTTAASYAVHAARAGVRTLVLSTDAAHSLGDALGVRLPDGEVVAIEAGMDALQVSARTSVEASWRDVQDWLLGVLDALGLDPVVAEELTSLPGADELAALSAVRTHVAGAQHDLVVVDCAPTAETLRLLALPEILAWHLERLLPLQRTFVSALRPAVKAAIGVPLPSPQVLAAIRSWHAQMRDVATVLTSAQASVRLVLTPEAVVIAEARRMLTSLSLYGYAVDAVVVNRLLPTGSDPWVASWNTAQAQGIEQVRESFDGIPILIAPYLAGEPVGVAALADLAERTDTSELGDRGITDPVEPAGLRVEQSSDGYVLRLPLPHATSTDVALSRRDDDLLVDVGGHHRVVTLPSVLRRCVVRGASVREGVLVVRFVPDEEVWPRDRRTADV